MRVEGVSEEIIELSLLEPYKIFFKIETDQIFVSKKAVHFKSREGSII
jgi:hypothetical protein